MDSPSSVIETAFILNSDDMKPAGKNKPPAVNPVGLGVVPANQVYFSPR